MNRSLPLSFSTLLLLAACAGDPPAAPPPSEVAPPPSSPEESSSEVELYISEHFTRPYNIEVVYRSDREAYPAGDYAPRTSQVLPVLKAIKALYLDVYAAEGVGGAQFLRGRTPLRIYLVGGRKWNAEGHELLAAPTASAIAMYVHGVNDFDPTSAASVYCLMRSVHYQAARRLLEVDGYDRTTFLEISATRYLHAPQGVPSGNTAEERRASFSTAAVSARQGFYSPFGRQDAEVDWADMLSVSLCHTPAQTAAILTQAAQYEVQPEDPDYTAANAREAERVTAMLTQKVAFLQQHMAKAYPFSLLRLQLAAVQALQNYTAP